jgi:adenylate cyclase
MPLEIERKFLVKDDSYKLESYQSTRITQGYISSASGRTVRVRIMGDKGFITIKGKSNASGTTRFEWEKEIPVADVEQLLQLCEPGIIDKTRYLVKAEPYTFEIDEFYGDNEGLTVAEIELPDEHANFSRPSWLDKEVTGDRRYYNSMLTKVPYKSWGKAER